MAYKSIEWDKNAHLTPHNLELMDSAILEHDRRLESVPGQIVGDHSEIFSDYQNNSALSSYSSTFGKNNVSGYKGFRIKDVIQNPDTPHIASIIVDDKDLDIKARDVYPKNTIIQFDAVNHYYNRFINYHDGPLQDAEGNSEIRISHNPYDTSSEITEDLKLDSDPNENWIWVFGKDYGEVITAQYASASFGRQNIAAGTCSFAAGRENNVANYGAAFGRKNEAGYASFVSGQECSAYGFRAFATNYYTDANGDASAAFGYATKANSNYSFTNGCLTTANVEFQTVVGKNNDANSKALFVVGNGELSRKSNGGYAAVADKASNAFEVFEDGYATIKMVCLTDDNSIVNRKYVDSKITFGTEVPDDSVGNIGDIFIKIIE